MFVWWAVNVVKNSAKPAASILRVAVRIILEIYVLNYLKYCEKNNGIANITVSICNNIRSNITATEMNDNEVSIALNGTT